MNLSDREHAVCDAIGRREADLLEQLRAHVAIPTGRGHEPGLDEYRGRLAERLVALGAEVTLVSGEPRPSWVDPPGAPPAREPPPVLVARRAGDGPRVLLVGHLDTVHDPHGDFMSLSAPRDGRVTGPGAVDMKGGLVVALSALEALADAGGDSGGWTVVLNSDEETGSFASDHVLRAEARRHDVGLVVEPALPGGALATARGGSGQLMVETRGRSAHAGREFAKGVSAVVALARVILALHALARPDEGVVVNVGPLRGGLVTNTVPDAAACWGNVRYPDTARAEALGVAIDTLATAGDSLPGVTVHRQWNRPAKPQTPAVTALAMAARQVAEDLGGTLPFATTGGVCDGNILQAEGLPTLDTLGVRGGNLHRTDEFVEVDSLVDRCRLLAVMLMRVCGGAFRSGRDPSDRDG